MLLVHVPTLSDGPWYFERLFRLWQLSKQDCREVRFDFSRCTFLGQSAVAFLGGLARLIHRRGGSVVFDWDSLKDAVGANLAQNGFMSAFSGPREPWAGNSIPYREDPWENAHDFQNYLADSWLGRGWVNVSSGLRDKIVGRVAEAYLNAFDHAKSPIGVFTCGQHFPTLHELKLTILDFGVGIPSNVRLFKAETLKAEALSAEHCMEWAFQRGTSTKSAHDAEGPRGLGLDLLQEFVRLNGGRLEMFSHEGYASIADGRVLFERRATFFEGTLVNISLRCDESYYCLASEVSTDEPF